MPFPFGSIAVFVSQTTNNLGERTAAVSTTVDGCAIWQTPGVQTVGSQDTMTYDAELLAPAGTSVNSTDRCTVDGVTYEVVSQPIAWKSPLTGWEPCIEVHLRRTDG